MLSAPEALRHWVREREATRIRKESGVPGPWTGDPIIAKYRFCNVRREDDSVTVWVRKNIREPFADHPHLWFMLAISRWINWPETMRELWGAASEGGKHITYADAWPSSTAFALDTLAGALHDRVKRGEKVFTGAYTINAPSTKGASKIDYVVNTVLGDLWRGAHRPHMADILKATNNPPSLRSVHMALSKYQGCGAFMSYQVVVDLRFTRYLQNADDVATWAAAGPGTIRGLNRIHNRRVDFPLDQGRALQEIRALFATIREETGVDMDLSDVPNILCETDKYCRVMNGEGAPRALYHPAAVAA